MSPRKLGFVPQPSLRAEIKDAMKASGAKGMQTCDDALYFLYKDGKISMEEALKNADSRNDLEGKINFG